MTNHQPIRVFKFDPLSDSRWNRFVSTHPDSSVFHSPPWLDALRRTYGYQPSVFTTSSPDVELRSALLVCRVESWLTGRRLVSLPFSDHCELLVDDESERTAILYALANEVDRKRMRYAEIRPIKPFVLANLEGYRDPSHRLHVLDLRPEVDTLFNNLHKNSTQRKIRRAEREEVTYLEGGSDFLLDTFSRLWLITRRRHLAPPQPKIWFRNLIECFGNALKIRIAFKDGDPVAAILTLQHKDALVYKYGCSDGRYHSLGGIHFLLWRAIRDAKEQGLCRLDLGRSDLTNAGLMTFKDRWGAHSYDLTYWIFSREVHPTWKRLSARENWAAELIRPIASRLPDGVFQLIGKFMYPHLG